MEVIKIELTDKQKNQLTAMPIVSTHITKSKDNSCIIVTTKFVKIYSRKYFEKVLEDNKTTEPTNEVITPVEKVKVD